MHEYQASAARYENMLYRKCGRSGLKLSAVGLGLWHGFGAENETNNETKGQVLRRRKILAELGGGR